MSITQKHTRSGKDFVVIGKYDYAQTELQQAARLKPESAEIHTAWARSYSGRDMFREAKSESRQRSTEFHLR